MVEVEVDVDLGSQLGLDEQEAAPEQLSGSRVVDTPLGAFEVPVDPQRIVVTELNLVLPTLLDLGIDVYGIWDASATATPVRTLVSQDEWDALAIVGSGIDPNVERLAAAQPDLVIHTPLTDNDVDLISPFSAIVPIEFTLSWKDDVRIVADAVDRVDEMETLLANYEYRAAELAARIDASFGDPSVAVLRVRPDSIRVHTNLHFSGELLTDMGLRVPADYEYELADSRRDAKLLVRLSPEQVGLLAAADYIFVMPLGSLLQTQDEVEDALEELQNGGLWRALPAVQEGRVTVVGPHWFSGSLRAAELALQDVESFMFG